MSGSIGIVVIGRNEGERLRRCLGTLVRTRLPLIYVDSGSSDSSRETAASLGVEVLRLDPESAFTSARARNAGFDRLVRTHPNLSFVQFVDGDCEVVAGWLDAARAALSSDGSLAVACGRRRERSPESSIYNRLCDIEWNTPVGEAQTCGGDFMVRVQAFREVGGFNPALVAGEEPELCLRLRRRGWRIRRLAHEMTLHDAAMRSLRQWWTRMRRCGHADAEAMWLHGGGPERQGLRRTLAALFWAAGVPAGVLAIGASSVPAGAAALLAYPLHCLLIHRRVRRLGLTPPDAWWYSLFAVLGKFPRAAGAARFLLGLLLQRPAGVFEYRTDRSRSTREQ